MTKKHLDEALETLVSVRPFEPFTIELKTGKRFKIDHPGATAWRDGAGVFRSSRGALMFFDHNSVNQIIKSTPRKRRSK